MARVFISYRRLDAKWAVGRIYDRLSQVLKKENIFLDVSDIEPGEDYVDRIRRIVETCDILLAVIGDAWLTSQDKSGCRRLDDPNDWVRIEIATALDRGIRVIPILVDDAPMPERHQLPEQLAGLIRRNAKLITFSHFHSDLDSLLRILEKVLQTSKPSESSDESANKQSTKNSATSDGIATAVKLPLTISLETTGGVATPLICCGDKLPAKNVSIFSTADDNQEAVDVQLYWGEGEKVSDNLLLGKFNLGDLPAAPKGVPQIEITTEVNKDLTMTVAAKDLRTGASQVLDAVDLSRVEIPDPMLDVAKTKPRKKESPLDPDNIFQNFGDLFGDLFVNRGNVRKKSSPNVKSSPKKKSS